MLTKKEAIRKHRAMWNWIGSMLKSGLWKSVIGTDRKFVILFNASDTMSVGDVVILLKHAYIHMIGDDHICNACYLCDYTIPAYGSCMNGSLCPINWPYIYGPHKCSYSLYYLIRFATESFEEAGDIAYQIANLPEREDD